MTNFKQIFAALALVAASSSAAMAQTDFGSGMGAGAGAGGAFAPNLPGLAGSGTARGLTGNGAAGLTTALNAFDNAGGPFLLITNPAGGNLSVPTNVLRALAALLNGRGNAAPVSIVTNALAGVPSASATALVTSLQTFGTAQSHTNLRSAVTAFNAAVDAVPAGTQPPPVMAAIRQALFQASRQ